MDLSEFNLYVVRRDVGKTEILYKLIIEHLSTVTILLLRSIQNEILRSVSLLDHYFIKFRLIKNFEIKIFFYDFAHHYDYGLCGDHIDRPNEKAKSYR